MLKKVTRTIQNTQILKTKKESKDKDDEVDTGEGKSDIKDLFFDLPRAASSGSSPSLLLLLLRAAFAGDADLLSANLPCLHA